MNTTELKMFDLLKDLKENHKISGIKISFEDESLTGELAQIISSIAFKAGVAVSLKIGGCEAKRDMHEAKVLGVDKIVAPMIESAHSLKKFVEAAHCIYTEDERKNTKFMINIETISGYNQLPEMVKMPEFREISGITFGRVDFSASLGKDRSFVNSAEMEEYALNIANIAKENGKKLFVGGAVSPAALDFFRKLPSDVLAAFETRNVIFDAQYSLNDTKVEHALVKAMGFELAWMQRKKEFYGHLSNAEVSRIAMIEKRYNDSKKLLK